MDCEKRSQLRKEIQPNLRKILSGFREVLEKYGISGVDVVEFKLDTSPPPSVSDAFRMNNEVEITIECWDCGPSVCCGPSSD